MSNSLQPHRPYNTPGSCLHGILQARILEWVAISFSRGSSLPRDQNRVSCIAGGFFTTIWVSREAWIYICTCVCIYMCVNICVCVYIYSYVHTCIYTCVHTHIHISSPAWEETCDRGEGYIQMSFFTTSYCIIWNRWSCSLRVTNNRVLIILHNHQLLVWSLMCVETQKSDIVDMPILLGKKAIP